VRLVEFLIHLLQTQALTLQRLAAFFGEDALLEMLEIAGESEEKNPSSFKMNQNWFAQPQPIPPSSPYTELEGAVREMNLPAVLEFHLWAYPFYRVLIESSLNLNSRIKGDENQVPEALIEESVSQAKAWIRKLPIRPELSAQAERAALIPWLRFRTLVLKKIGKRPIASV
jgi:hypothetical protein